MIERENSIKFSIAFVLMTADFRKPSQAAHLEQILRDSGDDDDSNDSNDGGFD